MDNHPKIRNLTYHEKSFEEIDRIREKIVSGDISILIKQTELYLYLNQMSRKYSFNLSVIQNISIGCFIATFIFFFINWKFSPLFFIAAIVTHNYSRKLALRYISVGLVKLKE